MSERLGRLASTIHHAQQVVALTSNSDPEPDHAYQADAQSGAGNCWCGRAKRHRRHPHLFLSAASDPIRCTCALPRQARCHLPADTPREVTP